MIILILPINSIIILLYDLVESSDISISLYAIALRYEEEEKTLIRRVMNKMESQLGTGKRIT